MFKHTLIAAALSGVLASSPTMATSTAADSTVSDTWAEASIATAFTLNEHLNPFDVDITVHKGAAHLQGVVETDVEKELAEHIALSVQGITEVKNNLRVANDAPRKSPSADFARAVRDATITARVKSQLMWNQSTSGLGVNVTTDQGLVSLEGTVASGAERELVRQIALNTNGVRAVDDRLKVEPKKDPNDTAGNPSPMQAIADLGEKSNDAWVTAKVKSVLLYSATVNGTSIDVDTKDGVVTLSGEVSDQYERAHAVRIASNIIGVKTVKSDLELSSNS